MRGEASVEGRVTFVRTQGGTFFGLWCTEIGEELLCALSHGVPPPAPGETVRVTGRWSQALRDGFNAHGLELI